MHENPYPTYERLREEAPAHHEPEMNFWALSRFDDVLAGFRDWETFSSTVGIALEDTGKGSAPSMIGMDPPVQTRLRKLIVEAFSPSRVGALEPRVRSLATHFLDGVAEAGECDLIERLAALLHSDVISTLLGAPQEDHASLRVWTETMMHREDRQSALPDAAAEAAGRAPRVFRRADPFHAFSSLIAEGAGDRSETSVATPAGFVDFVEACAELVFRQGRGVAR